MINNNVLGDITGIVRSNKDKLFGMNRKNTIRLNSLVSRLSLLGDIDKRFNEILDNLTKETLITLSDYDYFVDKINLLDENTINLIGENKQNIIHFFDSIKLYILKNMPNSYFNDKVTGIMEAGF
ncbi:MAG: hypothetical protein WC850_04045 [Candidatus Gracilibacteria bacterium]